MATLDHWEHWLDFPKTLVCPELTLQGGDFDPPLVIGKGEIVANTLNGFSYRMTGLPSDVGQVLRRLTAIRENPYDFLKLFRLNGKTEDGLSFSGGWTEPTCDIDTGEWLFTGEIQSLHFGVDVPPSPMGSSELKFRIPNNYRASVILSRFVRTEVPGQPARPEHILDVLGTKVRFAFDTSTGILSVSADHAPGFTPPYAENWLAEPFRILFGQLIYPRLVARNFAEGTAQLSVRRSPPFSKDASWAKLWNKTPDAVDKDGFWTLFSQLLTYIVSARGSDGEPNFEANKITHLYGEVIQASSGSRWVWALTFASSIEALVNLLTKHGVKYSGGNHADIKELVSHIESGPGERSLRDVAISAVHRTAETTTKKALDVLLKEGVIDKSQLKAWSEIRMSVMHGSLVSPYSTAEEDKKLLSLADMLHALTRELVRRATANPVPVSAV